MKITGEHIAVAVATVVVIVVIVWLVARGKGSTGPKGGAGPPGPPGHCDKGPCGAQGPTGVPGHCLPGPCGARGAPGQTGPIGPSGTCPTDCTGGGNIYLPIQMRSLDDNYNISAGNCISAFNGKDKNIGTQTCQTNKYNQGTIWQYKDNQIKSVAKDSNDWCMISDHTQENHDVKVGSCMDGNKPSVYSRWNYDALTGHLTNLGYENNNCLLYVHKGTPEYQVGDCNKSDPKFYITASRG